MTGQTIVPLYCTCLNLPLGPHGDSFNFLTAGPPTLVRSTHNDQPLLGLCSVVGFPAATETHPVPADIIRGRAVFDGGQGGLTPTRGS